MKQQTRHETVA